MDGGEKEVKYELTNETKLLNLTMRKVVLHRIRAAKSFPDVRKSTLGGWIEKESNLSQNGNSWIADNAMVFGDAVVCDDAIVRENAVVYDDATVKEDASVRGNAVVSGNSIIEGRAHISGDAWICGCSVISGDTEITEGTIKGKKE